MPGEQFGIYILVNWKYALSNIENFKICHMTILSFVIRMCSVKRTMLYDHKCWVNVYPQDKTGCPLFSCATWDKLYNSKQNNDRNGLNCDTHWERIDGEIMRGSYRKAHCFISVVHAKRFLVRFWTHRPAVLAVYMVFHGSSGNVTECNRTALRLKNSVFVINLLCDLT
jgi:hypothetical protein